MKRLLVLIAIGAVAVLIFRSLSHPVPAHRLYQLRKGMTQEEVRAILGPPTKTFPSGQWTYQRPFVFGHLNIHWHTNGTFGAFKYERF